MSNKSIFVCNGASNHTEKTREVNDFYATEPKAAELLLEQEKFKPCIWECACGAGHLSRVFQQHGYITMSTDLINRGYGVSGVDFLSVPEGKFDLSNMDIVTNPPYSLAQDFVEHALRLLPEGGKLAMFLKLTFLESKARKALFEVAPPIPIVRFVLPFAMRQKWGLHNILQRRWDGSRLRVVCLDKRVQGRYRYKMDKLRCVV